MDSHRFEKNAGKEFIAHTPSARAVGATKTFRVVLPKSSTDLYIHRDKKRNELHVIVPVIAGGKINTDNTCQSLRVIQDFFGRSFPAQRIKASALDELQRLQAQLQLTHKILSTITKKKKEAQRLASELEQIDYYIKALKQLDRNGIVELDGASPRFPQAVRDLLAQHENIFSMQLRPREMDPVLHAVNPIFSLNRQTPSRLQAILLAHFQDVRPSNSPRERLLRAVKEAQPALGINFHDIQITLTQKVKEYWGLDIDFTTEPADKTIAITQDSMNTALGLGPEDNCTVEDYTYSLISCCAAADLQDLPLSPFENLTMLQRPHDLNEELSIMTQFLLAYANIYCYANGLTKANYGEILDQRIHQQHLTELANMIKTALNTGESVEEAVLTFLNTHHGAFLIKKLSSAQIKEISEEFRILYNSIQGSPHYDEFFIYFSNKKGPFFNHQGAIGVPLAVFLASYLDIDNYHYFKKMRQQSETLDHVLMGDDAVEGETVVEISEGQLEEWLYELMGLPHTVPVAAQLLLLKTEHGHQKIFELLEHDMLVELKGFIDWPILQKEVRRYANQHDLDQFNQRFGNAKLSLIVTFSQAHSLYVALVDDIISMGDLAAQAELSDGSISPELMGQLIRRWADVTNVEAETNQRGEFVVTYEFDRNKYGSEPLGEYGVLHHNLNREYLESLRSEVSHKLRRIAREFNYHLYLSQTMQESLYQEACDLYGSDSVEIRTLNREDIVSLLRLVNIHITRENIRANNSQGCILRLDARFQPAFEAIHNIDQFHSRRRQAMSVSSMLHTSVDAGGAAGAAASLEERSDEACAAAPVLCGGAVAAGARTAFAREALFPSLEVVPSGGRMPDEFLKLDVVNATTQQFVKWFVLENCRMLRSVKQIGDISVGFNEMRERVLQTTAHQLVIDGEHLRLQAIREGMPSLPVLCQGEQLQIVNEILSKISDGALTEIYLRWQFGRLHDIFARQSGQAPAYISEVCRDIFAIDYVGDRQWELGQTDTGMPFFTNQVFQIERTNRGAINIRAVCGEGRFAEVDEAIRPGILMSLCTRFARFETYREIIDRARADVGERATPSR